MVEVDQITLAISVMSYPNAFASADTYGGSFAFGTATTNLANNYVNFEIDSFGNILSGNIQSKSTYDIDYDNGQTLFDMDVTYTHSDGAQA